MIDIRLKLEELGFIIKSPIKENKLNRCATIHKPHKKNGWFLIHDQSVSYGDWAGEIKDGYFWKDEKNFSILSQEEKIKIKTERDKQNRLAYEKVKKERMALIKACWGRVVPTEVQNAYLERKKCLYRDDFKIDRDGFLNIPMYDIKKQLVGYQIIDQNGNKKFKFGTLSQSAFYPIKSKQLKLSDLDLIFLCEGYATASSVYQALSEEFDSINYGVLACFSANQVDNVCNEIITNIGNKPIIAIKDQDAAGVDKVKTKGFTVGFIPGHDANDIHCEYGLDTLSKIIITKIKELDNEKEAA